MSVDTATNSMHCATSWSFKSVPNDDFIEESTISTTRWDKPGKPYGEIGDIFVDRLLLRDLFFHVNSARRNNLALTHLVVAELDERIHPTKGGLERRN